MSKLRVRIVRESNYSLLLCKPGWISKASLIYRLTTFITAHVLLQIGVACWVITARFFTTASPTRTGSARANSPELLFEARTGRGGRSVIKDNQQVQKKKRTHSVGPQIFVPYTVNCKLRVNLFNS